MVLAAQVVVAGSTRSDELLLERTAAGERAAFAELYDSMSPVVYGLARRVVVSPALAEEVTQEAFLEIWTKAATFDAARGSARAWIMTLTHRRAVDTVRREQASRDRIRRAPAGRAETPFDSVAEEIELRDVAQSNRHEVGSALATLSAVQRTAVELAYFDGYTYAQVAQVLGVPLGTAKTRIRDGLRRLRNQLTVSRAFLTAGG